MSRTEDWLQFRYEEVCAAPAEAQNRLIAWLGAASPTSGLPQIDVSRIGDVRPDTGKAERIWSICGRLASELGYELPVSIMDNLKSPS
jgi:hypothetical protein